MPKLDRFIVAILADEHAGSKLALCNPDTKVYRPVPVVSEDGITEMGLEEVDIERNPVMDLIWEKYEESVDYFVEVADGDPIFVIKLGEVCEGTYYANSSMHLKKDQQVQIAVNNMAPWLGVDNVKMIRICSGDRAHEFDEGSASRIVAGRLKRDFPDVKVIDHGLLDIHGFRIDYAHRGPGTGIRKWTEGNVARYYLTDYMMREMFEFGRTPADLVLRAHYHEPVFEPRYIRKKNGLMRSAILVSPCLKFPDRYAKTVTQNKFSATIGTTAVEVVNGEILKLHDKFTTVDTRTREVYDG